MRKKILSEYNILMKEMGDIEEQYELELYTKVNSRIEKILSESDDCVKKLETLICTFEAKNAYNSYNANLALAYVVVSFNMGFLPNILNVSENKQIFFVITHAIYVGALMLFGYAWKEHKLEQKRAFILNLLRFRYEEIKNREALAVEDGRQHNKFRRSMQ